MSACWVALVLAGCDSGTLRASGAAAVDSGPADDTGANPPSEYPILLAHGFFGFDRFADVDRARYFWGVEAHLDALGYDARTTEVDPFNDSWHRGAELLEQVEEIAAVTGKVHLIGHSQGGLDARVVAHERPDLVASVTTIATPHNGTPLGDVVLDLVPSPMAEDLVDWLVRNASMGLWDAAGQETSLFAAMYQYSQPGITAFNEDFPDPPDVPIYSLTGRTDRHAGGTECAVADAPEFVARWSSTLDPVDPALWLPEVYLDGGLSDPFANDGLLRVKDSQRGRFLGCVPADHLDEIGQVLGDEPGLGNAWDHLEFYAELAAFLQEQ